MYICITILHQGFVGSAVRTKIRERWAAAIFYRQIPLNSPIHQVLLVDIVVPAMGLLGGLAERICAQCSTQSTLLLTVSGFLTLVTVAVLINVLRQLLFKNPHEPPVVFHWFPFVGSTVTYGLDPYAFFFNCKEKVFLNSCQ